MSVTCKTYIYFYVCFSGDGALLRIIQLLGWPGRIIQEEMPNTCSKCSYFAPNASVGGNTCSRCSYSRQQRNAEALLSFRLSSPSGSAVTVDGASANASFGSFVTHRIGCLAATCLRRGAKAVLLQDASGNTTAAACSSAVDTAFTLVPPFLRVPLKGSSYGPMPGIVRDGAVCRTTVDGNGIICRQYE